jgi:hypothetical protein
MLVQFTVSESFRRRNLRAASQKPQRIKIIALPSISGNTRFQTFLLLRKKKSARLSFL